jgi:hypothetical protein
MAVYASCKIIKSFFFTQLITYSVFFLTGKAPKGREAPLNGGLLDICIGFPYTFLYILWLVYIKPCTILSLY